MTPGPEVALITSQFSKRASIFACNDYAVISVQNISLGKDECGHDVYTWFNPDLKNVNIGTLDFAHGVTTNSWLNTGTFINAWDMLISSQDIWKNQWIVKVDPDAVFFPDRMRQHLAPHTGKPRYMLNCMYMKAIRIFGAVEVFSVPAIGNYKDRVSVCKNLDWHGWGEDAYMQTCMDALGVPGVWDLDMVGDSRCRARACTDTAVTAYHPHKDVADYWACWDQSRKAEIR